MHLRVSQLASVVLHAYGEEMIPSLVVLKGVLNQEVCVAMAPCLFELGPFLNAAVTGQ